MGGTPLGLLHDLRQFFLPNCYSVATLSYGIRTDPVRILNIYKQLIAEGAIEVSAGIKIPVARIAIDRLMFDPDLDSIVDVALFLRSTLFQTITRVAKMQVSTPIEEDFLILREVLKRVSLSSASPQATFIAALLTMGSYKRNVLQEMVLSQMEFLETNRTQLLTRRDHSPRAVKGQFIEFLHRSIFGQIQKTFPDYLAQESIAEFFLELKEEMERRFWLQDCSKPVKVVSSDLIVNNLDGTAVRVTCNNDNIQTVKDFFSQHRRLLYIKEGGVVYVDHLDNLRKVIKEIVQDVLAKNSHGKDDLLQEFGLLVVGFSISYHLRVALSEFLQAVNKSDVYFSSAHYLLSGLIGFKQDGGVTGDFPIKMLGISPVSESFSSTAPAGSFLKLFKYLHAHTAKSEFLSKWILCSSESHAFLMQPALFSPLWNNNPPEPALINYGWQYMRPLLGKVLTRMQMLDVLCVVFNNSQSIPLIFNSLSQFLSANDFWKYFYSCCGDMVLREKFDLALYNLLTRLPISLFSVKKLLNPDSPDTFAILDIDFKVQQECVRLSQTSLPVLQLAGILQKILIQYGKFYTVNELEREICIRYQLPVPWIIGDLNWGDYQEAPQHHLLVMRTVMNRLMFFSRNELEEYNITPSLYRSFRQLQIFYV